MKLSFNLLRPIIFFFCGLGYLPLHSADTDSNRNIASIENEVTQKTIVIETKDSLVIKADN